MWSARSCCSLKQSTCSARALPTLLLLLLIISRNVNRYARITHKTRRKVDFIFDSYFKSLPHMASLLKLILYTNSRGNSRPYRPMNTDKAQHEKQDARVQQEEEEQQQKQSQCRPPSRRRRLRPLCLNQLFLSRLDLGWGRWRVKKNVRTTCVCVLRQREKREKAKGDEKRERVCLPF